MILEWVIQSNLSPSLFAQNYVYMLNLVSSSHW